MKKPETKKRETVGKISQDLISKSSEYNHTPTEQMQEQLKDFEKNMDECISRCLKDYDGDFYIVVTTKKERLLQNVIRNFFMGRHTCPTPEYDQTTYKYNRKAGCLEFLWVVPAKDICTYFITNALTLPRDQVDLLEFIMDFTDGTLLRHAKKLNNEQEDSPILIQG